MRTIREVHVIGQYRLNLVFDDGVTGSVDLSSLVGKGVFSLWNDPAAFARVRIGTSGKLLWDDSVDLCPDALYLQVTGKQPEDLFPGLRRAPSHA